MASNSYNFEQIQGSIIGTGVDGNGNIVGKNIEVNIGLPQDIIKKIMAIPSNLALRGDGLEQLKYYNPGLEKIVDRLCEEVERIKKERGVYASAIKDNQLEISYSEISRKRNILRRLKNLIGIGNDGKSLIRDEALLWYNRGFDHNASGNYKEAIKCLDKAIELKNDYVKAWISKSFSYRCLNRYDIALQCCDRALDLNSHDAYAWSKKARILYELNLYDESLSCYDKALKIKSYDHETLAGKGKCLFKMNKYKAAIECYDKALKTHPDRYSLWYGEGLSYQHLKMYKQAIKCYDNAILLNSRDGDLWFNRARCKIIDKQIQEGFQDLEHAFATNRTKYLAIAAADKDFKNLWKNKKYKALVKA